MRSPDGSRSSASELARLAAADGALHDIHNVRVRDSDAGEFVNFHCRANPAMTVTEVHQRIDEIERGLRRAFPTVKRVISHAEPRALEQSFELPLDGFVHENESQSCAVHVSDSLDERRERSKTSLGQIYFDINDSLTLDKSPHVGFKSK